MVSLPNARPRYRPDAPKSRTPRSPGVRGGSPGAGDDLRLYAISFAVFLAAAVFFFYGLGVFNQDALSRTLDAHNVLSSRDPHLGAIGLAWPPIPTFMRVVLMPAFDAVGLTEFVGPFTSVIAAAGCVVVLNRILARFGFSAATRGVWIVASMANPVLLYHFVNGTAESLFALLFLFVLHSSLRLREAPERAVIGMGLGAGGALWVRYEALAIVGTAVLGFLLMAYLYRRERAWRGVSRIESLLVTLAFPSAFLGALWLLFNWTAQGDPLFFYHGPYSINAAPDVAKNAADHALTYAYGSVTGTLSYVAERTMQVAFVFPFAAAAAAAVGLLRRDITGTVLALLTVSTLLLQAYQTYTGTIAPWLRYWVYLPLFTPILLAWLTSAYPFWLRGASMANLVRNGVVPGLFLLSAVISFQVMGHDDVGADEQLVLDELAGNEQRIEELRAFYPDRDVLDEVRRHLATTEGLVLVDVQKAAVLILESDDAGRLAINTDRDFDSLLSQPIGQVDYVLLPDPRGTGVEVQRDAIYTRYPDLYDGAAWLDLDRHFEGEHLDWRLYRVIDPADVDEDAPD
ncbi:MAG: hypothetical protein WD058_07055 [Dehalococcoidia bacterium]